jgi:pectate lyase
MGRTKAGRCIALVAAAIVAGPALAATADRPIGFGRDTIGGCSSMANDCTCVVTTPADDPSNRTPGTLRGCLTSERPQRVVFEWRGTLRLDRPIAVASHKTLTGEPLKSGDGPVTITGPGRLLMLIDRDDVIISDLKFRIDPAGAAPSCANPQTPRDVQGCGIAVLAEGSRNIWIHHNDFAACGSGCIALWTRDNTKAGGGVAGTDAVSISNNRFRDSYYGLFAGAGNFVAPRDIPKRMRISVYDNVFENIFRRSPKASSGVQIHLFNNVIRDWGQSGKPCTGQSWGFGASSTGEAQLLAENNLFAARAETNACHEAIQAAEKRPRKGYVRDEGLVRATGNVFQNGAMAVENRPAEVFDPTSPKAPDLSYAYTLKPADRLEDVEREAGPRGFKVAN